MSTLRAIFVLVCLATISTRALAQQEGPTKITSQNRTGDLPFSSTVGTDLEYVDVASGNLVVKIPIASAPGRGQDYNFGLRYGGQFFVTGTRTSLSTSITYQIWAIEKRPYLGGIGWVDSKSAVTYGTAKVECLPDNFNTTYKVYYMYHDASGGKHRLAVQKSNLTGGTCSFTDPQGPDLGGDGNWANIQDTFLDVGAPVRLADGTVATMTPVNLAPDPSSTPFPTTGTSWKDPNGNSLAEGAGVTDTLGRVIVTQQNLTNQILYKVYDSGGVQRTYTVNYAPIALSTHFNVIGRYNSLIGEYNNTGNAVTSIVLPNGRSYQFLYENDFGALRQITLPTGAVISYTWATLADSDLTHRYVASRTVTVNGQSHTWTFSRTGSESGGNSITVTATDPAGNQSVYTVGDGAVRVAKFYQGIATGTPLRQHDITYAADPDPWSDPTGMNDYEPAPVALRPIRITTTLEDGKVSKKEFDYDSFNYIFHDCYGWPCGPLSTFTTSRGNVTEIREYDWGAGTPGPLVRRTARNYLHTGDANYLARNIVNKVLSETVYDGAGVQKARTEYEYDSTAITATSGAPQHDYTNYGSTFLYRGNATKVKRWRNTDGATLTTSYVYDDLGNIRSITDPGLHTTTWDYTDAWANSSCLPPSNSLAYVTQATNHLGHRLQLMRYPCTGQVQARKDENDIVAARAGTTFTYDLFGRTLTQVAPDTGQVTNVYNDTPPVTVTATTKITATLNLVSVAVRDGLGRVTQTKLTSDPEGTVYADTTYDGFGRSKTASNPYRLTSDPTYGVTQTQYDALGRVSKVIPPDGSSTVNNISTVYAGTTTTVTDQAGMVRRSETDALGRLIRVWEPNGFIASSTVATGTVTIIGDEESVEVESCQDCGFMTVWDTGTVTVTVGGFARSVNYGATSTATGLAASLASAFNASTSSPVTALASNGLITFTSKVTGPSGNYTLTASSTTTKPQYFSMPSFSGVPPGSTLTGGGSGQTGDLTNPRKTRYFYDTLDNLACVLQLSTDAEPATCTSPSLTWRPRTFTYNSLSQLLTAVNPESGTITYTYDSDGNVLSKVAPKPNQTGTLTVTTTYTYDALHRLTQKSYNDGATALVKYGYDGVALTGCTTAPPSLTILNPKGRRTAMCDASGATAWSYDALGRALTEKRAIVGSSAVTKTTSYTYNLDGSLATLTYPSGRIITYAPSAAGRTLSAVDTANSINYATAALYAPHGALSSLKNGVVTGGFTGITTTNSYNKRLQPALLSATAPSATVLSLSYDFNFGTPAAPINNGNVKQIINNRDNNRTQSFTYDELNRIKMAQSQATSGANCWGNSFSYDIWANLLTKTVTKCTAESLSVTVSTKNQITNAGFTYDAAGNLINSGAGVMTYDAENRLTNAAGVTYTYDADGGRVKKSSGKLYWTGMGSDALAETDLAGVIQSEFTFFNGKRVARRDGSGNTVFYYFSDHLGSADVITGATGAILEESDYYPFGGERVITNSDPNPYKFTGKERDSESGLDYFIARHYSSSLGRFLQPDWDGRPVTVPYADFGNPQSLNLYTYVGNNPIGSADPDGHQDPQPFICTWCRDVVVDFAQRGWEAAKDYVQGAVGVLADATLISDHEVAMPPSNVPETPAGEAGALTTTVGLSLVGGEAATTEKAVAGIERNAAKGAASEARVLEDIGAAKNTKSIVGTEGKSVPDFQDSKVVGEIKDANTVSNTRQVRIQKEAAQQTGREHQLITGTKTHVTNNAKQGTRVIRREDLGPK